MKSSNIRLLLGGSWHDFEGFAACMTTLLTQAGFALRASHDLDQMASLDALDCGVVVLYTCLDEQTPQDHTLAQTDALCRWVNAGGGLLAIHSATVAARRHMNLKSLIGGSFISHPAKATFIVEPVQDSHAIVKGLEPFAVEDELYLHEVDSSVRIHLRAQHAGHPQPLAWSRAQGDGRVVYFALGHDENSWSLAAYQKIVLQSIGWLLTR